MMQALGVSRQVPFEGDTLALFQQLTDDARDTVLFESRDSSGRFGTKSLLFVRAALRIDIRGQQVTLTALTGSGASAVGQLRQEIASLCECSTDGDNEKLVVDFPAPARTGTDAERLTAVSPAHVLRVASRGWTLAGEPQLALPLPGVFSYDFVGLLEALPEPKVDRHGFPDAVFWLPERVVLVDHLKKSATVTVFSFARDSSPGQVDRCDKALDELCQAVELGHPSPRPAPTDTVTSELAPDVDMDDDSYARLVGDLQEHIRAGDVFQIVPSRTFSVPCGDPIAAYRQLRRLNPSPYMFVIRGPDFDLFGASPEACVTVNGQPSIVRLHPIAGTRPRARRLDGSIEPDRDNRLEAELKLHHKELAEHMMLVDLARNDVARISVPGTRRVSRLLEVERYSHVMHLVSEVEGQLRDGLDALDAYLACANMGTLVGAPKIEAAQLLRHNEVDKRGPYGGAVGYLTADGELDSAIVIRSALVRNGTAHVRAGAGVVNHSEPEAEAQETRSKAMAVLRAIAMSEGSTAP